MLDIYACNIINLNRVISHTVIRLRHGLGHSKSTLLSVAPFKIVLRSSKLKSLFEMKFSVSDSTFCL